MRSIMTALSLAVAAAAVGCASDDRQWMKPSEKYTTEEFRRDHAACTLGGKLDDACMRSRGWVTVNPLGKAEQPKDPHARDIGAPASRRY